MHPTGVLKMSLQALNEEYQLEIAQRDKKISQGAFGRLKGNHFGGIFRSGEYPDTRKLEELLLSFE